MRLKLVGVKAKERGYSLVELLIVFAIMGVIIAISANGLMLQQKKARDARRKADLQQIRSALEQYRTENGYYRKHGAITKVADHNDYYGIYTDSGTLPEDPKEGFIYRISFSGCSVPAPNQCQTYALQAVMEVSGSNFNCPNPPFTPLICKPSVPGALPCNYCVTQP